jgi:DNA-binding GntR family transcriptional regulator
MPKTARKIPTHELTYARLRDMILFGELQPGQPVTIQGLIQDLGAGMTPVREAIRRLAAEGALTLQGNRRVVVPRLSAGDLDQLAFVRKSIEPRLAELAMPRLTAAVIRKLEQIDVRLDAAMRAGDLHGYLESNHAFHFTIYEAAESGVLLDIARSLWLRFGPSLRVVSAQNGATSLPDAHKVALSAMRQGDAAGLAKAVGDDIDQGIAEVRRALDGGNI